MPPHLCQTWEAREHHIQRRTLAIRGGVRTSDMRGGILAVNPIKSLCGHVDTYDVCDALTLVHRQAARRMLLSPLPMCRARDSAEESETLLYGELPTVGNQTKEPNQTSGVTLRRGRPRRYDGRHYIARVVDIEQRYVRYRTSTTLSSRSRNRGSSCTYAL